MDRVKQRMDNELFMKMFGTTRDKYTTSIAERQKQRVKDENKTWHYQRIMSFIGAYLILENDKTVAVLISDIRDAEVECYFNVYSKDKSGNEYFIKCMRDVEFDEDNPCFLFEH
jgi:hypothetical protein